MIDLLPSLPVNSNWHQRSPVVRCFPQAAVVPKSWFVHFYITGSLVNAACLGWLAHSRAWPCYGTHAMLAGILFQFHLARRLLECLFVHSYAPGSSMPMLVYLGGIAHYVFSPLSLVSNTDNCESPHGDNNPLFRCVSAPTVAAGIAIFAFGNLLQHVCHRYLASLRETGHKKDESDSGDGQHFLPSWGPFRYVYCPHYTAEVCIYVGLWLVCGPTSFTPFALACWTAANLSVTGSRTLQWYKQTFGPERTRTLRAIFPGLV